MGTCQTSTRNGVNNEKNGRISNLVIIVNSYLGCLYEFKRHCVISTARGIEFESDNSPTALNRSGKQSDKESRLRNERDDEGVLRYLCWLT